jgi:hypothetical protein
MRRIDSMPAYQNHAIQFEGGHVKFICVFLSSTFRDFAWEREILNRSIVPSVNAEVRLRELHIDLIDLRGACRTKTGWIMRRWISAWTKSGAAAAGRASPTFVTIRV